VPLTVGGIDDEKPCISPVYTLVREGPANVIDQIFSTGVSRGEVVFRWSVTN